MNCNGLVQKYNDSHSRHLNPTRGKSQKSTSKSVKQSERCKKSLWATVKSHFTANDANAHNNKGKHWHVNNNNSNNNANTELLTTEAADSFNLKNEIVFFSMSFIYNNIYFFFNSYACPSVTQTTEQKEQVLRLSLWKFNNIVAFLPHIYAISHSSDGFCFSSLFFSIVCFCFIFYIFSHSESIVLLFPGNCYTASALLYWHCTCLPFIQQHA